MFNFILKRLNKILNDKTKSRLNESYLFFQIYEIEKPSRIRTNYAGYFWFGSFFCYSIENMIFLYLSLVFVCSCPNRAQSMTDIELVIFCLVLNLVHLYVRTHSVELNIQKTLTYNTYDYKEGSR